MKILLVTIGSLSHVNDRLASSLEALGHKIIRVDLLRYIERRNVFRSPYTIGLSLLIALLKNPRTFKDDYKKTAFAFRRLSKIATELVRNVDCDIIIQTQVFFGIDRRFVKTPVFIYTDFTHHLFNLDIESGIAPKSLRKISNKTLKLETDVYHAVDKVFVYTPYMKNDLTSFYGLEDSRVEAIGIGISVRFPDQLPIRSAGHRLIFIGIDYERKGGALAVAAFRQVVKRYPDATLQILGASPAISEKGIEVLGRVSLAQVEACLSEADIFIMSSFQEPCGLAPLEAMAFNVPVVAVKLNSLDGHLVHGVNCIFVDDHDATELANAIIMLFEDPTLMRNLGNEGRRIVRQNYCWDKVADRLMNSIGSGIA